MSFEPTVKPIMFCMTPCLEILDSIKGNTKIDTVHLYVDLKNSSSLLFIPDAVEEMINDSTKLKSQFESSIFQSILLTASNWITAAKQRGLKIKIFFCNDKGKSKYHHALNPKYKANRKISRTVLASEEFSRLKDTNWKLADQVCSKLNDVYFISLEDLESDFIPYYIITRMLKNQDNVYHILSSNDKDHFQVLNLPNTVMFSRKGGTTNILDKQSYLSKFLKVNKASVNTQSNLIELMSKVDPEHIAVMMAICGDKSDNVFGLHKIGEKGAIKMLANKEVVDSLLGTSEDIETRIQNGQKVIKENPDIYDSLDKQWKQAYDSNELLTASYRQISYESLVRWLEKQDHTFKINRLEKINEIYNKPVYNYDKNILINNVKRLEDCVLTEQNLYNLF